MDFRTQTSSLDALSGVNADALVLVLAGDTLPVGLDASVAAAAKDAIKLGDFELKAGKTLVLPRVAGLKAPRLVLACAGKASLKSARSAVQSALSALKSGGTVHAALAFAGFDSLSEALVEQTVLAALEVSYVYRHTKPSAPAAPKLAKLSLLLGKDDAKAAKAGLARGQAIGAGIELAREAANRPPNYATPTFLAEQVKALGKSHGLKVEVLDQKAVEKLGMGSFLAVAKGSTEPLRFIVARYEGAAKTVAPVVLVGKGITFDSGGISLKPGAGMDEMKFDMGGAASVLGTLRAVAELKPKLNLVAIIAACENMPAGNAVKPGDVVTSMSGQTIEILNTDAEGRLILCDALSYAERFKPAVVVDVATLTGACVIALGGVRSGMYASDDELAGALLAAGDAALDPCWRMPLDDEYEEGLKSNFADVANVAGREGGSITAAKFLQRFASKYRWAHLDIAGTAWKSGGAKGGTGRPVGLLTHFLLSQVR
ncbi:MAG: leucyl aminopeptidase [Roseateles asaccharophilus]|uniref:Probable cytosol aminopeptidase n=1 Tax=Roseateles asaccharophilus TaxID=582607 RepID=A0A4R6N9A3_9BURK|nr:leucyl aminopeptidase [Roseateles asaccharophilus]MDN3543510.1 leucyl aminopeptidase [Roseateles asaccharophilus]TDP12112.1 aminopeptidase A [Roseateles asaccharophilus]